METDIIGPGTPPDSVYIYIAVTVLMMYRHLMLVRNEQSITCYESCFVLSSIYSI